MDAFAKRTRDQDRTFTGSQETRKLAVVIVTYNSAAVLPGLLDSLPAGLEGVRAYEVVLVDNASHDGSGDLALAHSMVTRVIRMKRNAGYAAGINAASATIGADADLLILNPDIRLYPGAARRLSTRLLDASVGVAVPQILDIDGEVCHSLRREPSLKTVWAESLVGGTLAACMGWGETLADPALYGRGGVVEWATGAILAISARARQMVGDWDESFFLYSEEVDYLRRVRRSGFLVLYDPNARAVHIGGEYQRNTYLSALLTLNRIRYYRRHHGAATTMLFRLGIIVGKTIRAPGGPGHRAALRAALTLSVKPAKC
ncbi:glycosyltransferase family 2 protein [Sinorhizobium numidicum]|uniref:Glycosyltransferase family 2 protein n=1 Tax=Sinorhizobium numidicum TaxID=680248 RepID=A0ABY8CUT6_9HYPH|nr:glycosyltransferase family 2 protein [Sinorhizobium numidicum]WEX75014.1 glycosyltransferase family 2 protein [Sinorhizobium numidicum]WEX81008.1 glycosyltransferase family 2 protein [Sinorhizobium numidicum]